MAIATTAFIPSPPMDPTDKQKYRTRLASAGATTSPRTTNMNLHVSVGAHNLRILKKAGTEPSRTSGNSTPVTPTPSNTSKQRKYERKSKRFLWPDELHRLFVAAIFDIGLKNASPKALLSIMSSAGASSDLTTEHLKSHLQKYRLNYERSRLEFLEFYDESARRSHKRRRKSASRSSSRDHNNTAFVFPISHKRDRSHGDDGSSDDDSGSEVTSDMDGGSGASLTESPRDNTNGSAPDVIPSDKAEVKTEGSRRRRASSPPAKAPQGVTTERQTSEPPTPTYAAPIQPYQEKPKTNATSGVVDGISDRMVAAAAAAAVAAVPFGGLNTLNDPQWNILNSLISPQLVASRGPRDGAADSTGLSLASMGAVSGGKLPGGLDQFSLGSVESADLQMQMHLAMQAQMNLHRQMLTRKVEVAQHIHNQQQQQDQAGKPPTTSGQADPAWNATAVSNAKSATTSVSSTSKQSSLLSDLPSSRLLGSLLSNDNNTASFATSAASAFATSATTSSTSALLSTVESSVSTTLLGLQGADFADAAALASLETVGANEKTDEGESLSDLYRWDKMDFTMDLDDDDLFGFLKS